MVRQDHTTTSEPTTLSHDGTPVAKQSFEVSATRTMTTGNGGEALLGEVQDDVLNTLAPVVATHRPANRLPNFTDAWKDASVSNRLLV